MDARLRWFLVLFLPILGWSYVSPHDRFTWWLESIPALVGIVLLLVFRRRFPLSSLLLTLLWLHCVLLVVGGHYTYAQVPLGEWAKGWFGWDRNNYDKLGHFTQGFVPAILAREILLRTSPLGRVTGPRPSRWLGFIVVSICLAFSACYELVEWLAAVSTGEAANDFLGTQGDPWDTQKDMLWALIGATTAMIGFSRWHDRSLQNLSNAKTGAESRRD